MTQPTNLRGIFSGKGVVLPDWMPLLYVAAAGALIAALGIAALFDHGSAHPSNQAATSPLSAPAAPAAGGAGVDASVSVVDPDGNPASIPDDALVAAKTAIPVGAENVVLLVASNTGSEIDLRLAYDPDGAAGPATPVLVPVFLRVDDAGGWQVLQPGA